MSNCIIFSGGINVADEWPMLSRTIGSYRIASGLQDAGYTTFVLDFTESLTIDEIIKVLENHVNSDTLWVGFSSTFYWPKFDNPLSNPDESLYTDTSDKEYEKYTKEMYFNSDYTGIVKIINFIKQNSNAKIIYGGTRAPYYAAQKIDIENIDYYVTGYADVSIIELTDYLAGKKDKIEHLKDKVIHSDDYPEPDTNNIPTHWWKKEFNILPNEGLPIELARGCIFKCKFCNYTLTGKKKGTYLRDSYQVKDELIKNYEMYGTDSYMLTDDTFNDDNYKLEKLHEVFTSLPFKPKFSAFLRVDLIHRYFHQVDLLSEMGIVGAFFGIETLNPESARAIGKGLHPNKVKDCLYKIHEKWKNKTNIESGFILGLPYDRLSYFHELANWCTEEDNPIQAIRFYPLRLYYYKEYEQLKIQSSPFSANPEIYGYVFTSISNWQLPSQKLSFTLCREIATRLSELVRHRNMIASFQVIQAMNCGVPLSDILTMTDLDIIKKYNVPEMKKEKINQYKKLIGL